MFRTIALAVAFLSLCFGQASYQFVSLTGNDIHRFATASMLSQNGAAICRLNANGQAAVVSQQLGTVMPAFAESINGINAAGDIVGATHEGKAFVSQPPYDAYLDLSGVFPSPFGFGTALAINDRGDILGTPFENTTWFPGLDISVLQTINNAGQVVAAVSVPPGYQYFLFTPGHGDTVLPAPPRALNNSGDMLFGESGAQYIQTASAQIPLPSAYNWTGINDRDEAVGFSSSTTPFNVTTITPVYYSTATGLIDLSTRFENTHALVSTTPVAINNSGQILVNYAWMPFPGLPIAPSAGIGLLVPAVSPSSGHAALRKSAPAASRARVYTVNGVRIPSRPR